MKTLINKFKNIDKKSKDLFFIWLLIVIVLSVGLFYLKSRTTKEQQKNLSIKNQFNMVTKEFDKSMKKQNDLGVELNKLKENKENLKKELENKKDKQITDLQNEQEDKNVKITTKRTETTDLLLFKYINNKMGTEVGIKNYQGQIENGWSFFSSSLLDIYSYISILDIYMQIDVNTINVVEIKEDDETEDVDEINEQKYLEIVKELDGNNNGIISEAEAAMEGYSVPLSKDHWLYKYMQTNFNENVETNETIEPKEIQYCVEIKGQWLDDQYYSDFFYYDTKDIDLNTGDEGKGQRKYMSAEKEIERAREILKNRNIKGLDISEQWDWIGRW